MTSPSIDSEKRPGGKEPGSLPASPLFIFIGHDEAKGPERRNKNRAGHLAFLEKAYAEGQLAYDGPIRDDSDRSIGAMLVFSTPDLAAARRLVESDPYFQAGVYASHELRPFVKVFPRGQI